MYGFDWQKDSGMPDWDGAILLLLLLLKDGLYVVGRPKVCG